MVTINHSKGLFIFWRSFQFHMSRTGLPFCISILLQSYTARHECIQYNFAKLIMPHFKKIPTLKTLSLRKLAWPDAVDRLLEEKDKHIPSVESYLRFTLVKKYFEREKAKIKVKRRHNTKLNKAHFQQITEDIVNSWIRLSNFYETRLNELDSLSMFTHLSTVGKMDFLHEGFTLRYEKNFRQNIMPYIGVVPCCLKPQVVDYRTWLDLVNVMITEGICDSLEHLYISLGNDRISLDKIAPTVDLSSPAMYRFDETLEYFINLKTITVRGDVIRDDFMMAVGECCYFLEYLDVRGTQVTDRGVALLLFRKLGKRFFQGAFLPSHCRFKFFPREVLRPCCVTLKYLDVSETKSFSTAVVGNSYHLYISRACPQLRSTPLRFYYAIPGRSRVIMKRFFCPGRGLLNFRQELVQYVRQIHCEPLYEFTRVLLLNIHFEQPRLEVVENEFGEETAFLFKSGSSVLVHCEMEKLTILNLVSYARNVLACIPITDIAKFAPNLQKLKASLTGTLSEELELKSLKYLCCPMIKTLETLESIVEYCSSLEYLEVQNIMMLGKSKEFGDREIARVFQKDPGEYASLEVLRFLFPNKVMLYPGLSWVAVRCPALRIVGDMSLWKIPFNTILRVFANTSVYNYDFAVEYRGVLHFCDRSNNKELSRFE